MPRRSPSSTICMTSVSPIWIFNKFQQPRLTCEAKTSLKRRRTRPAFVKPRVESMGLRGGCQAWVRFCGLYYHPLNTWTLEHFDQNSSVFASARAGGRWYNMVFSRWDLLMPLQMFWESPLTKTCPALAVFIGWWENIIIRVSMKCLKLTFQHSIQLFSYI